MQQHSRQLLHSVAPDNIHPPEECIYFYRSFYPGHIGRFKMELLNRDKELVVAVKIEEKKRKILAKISVTIW